MSKVPDSEIIDSILNIYFLDVEPNGWAVEDENGAIYIYNANGSINAFISPDTWFELLTNKEEEENNEIIPHE